MIDSIITEENSKIYLKKLNISEIDDRIIKWFEDETLMKYYTSSKNKITKQSLIKSILKGEEDKTSYTYGVYYHENNLCIGTVKLGPINHVHRISDLAVLLGDTDYHGKGLGVESVRLGNKLAFEVYDIRKLVSGMYENNISSIKAYVKAGWIIEGSLRGHYLENGKPQDRILVGCFNPRYFE